MAMNTTALLGGSLLARVPPGEELWIEPDACVVQYLDGDLNLFYPPDGGRQLTVPEAGDCYAVSRRELHMKFGMAQLGVCTVDKYPDRTFSFGAHGRFAVSLAHVTGLRSLVQDRRPERMELSEVYQLLLPSLRRALADAVGRVNGPGTWRYENLWSREARQKLSRECWEGFFRIFFAHGLLLPRQQFNLEDINAPFLPR